MRADRDYPAADEVRRQLNEAGFILEDATEATRTRPKSELEKQREELQRVSSSKEVGSLLDAGDETEFSVGIVACNYLSDLQTMRPEPPSPWREALPGGGDSRHGSTDGTSSWLEEQARREPRLRVIHTDHVLGDAAAKNILLKQSRGTYFVLMDTSVEAHDDFLAPYPRPWLMTRWELSGRGDSEARTCNTSTRWRMAMRTRCRATASHSAAPWYWR